MPLEVVRTVINPKQREETVRQQERKPHLSSQFRSRIDAINIDLQQSMSEVEEIKLFRVSTEFAPQKSVTNSNSVLQSLLYSKNKPKPPETITRKNLIGADLSKLIVSRSDRNEVSSKDVRSVRADTVRSVAAQDECNLELKSIQGKLQNTLHQMRQLRRRQHRPIEGSEQNFPASPDYNTHRMHNPTPPSLTPSKHNPSPRTERSLNLDRKALIALSEARRREAQLNLSGNRDQSSTRVANSEDAQQTVARITADESMHGNTSIQNDTVDSSSVKATIVSPDPSTSESIDWALQSSRFHAKELETELLEFEKTLKPDTNEGLATDSSDDDSEEDNSRILRNNVLGGGRNPRFISSKRYKSSAQGGKKKRGPISSGKRNGKYLNLLETDVAQKLESELTELDHTLHCDMVRRQQLKAAQEQRLQRQLKLAQQQQQPQPHAHHSVHKSHVHHLGQSQQHHSHHHHNQAKASMSTNLTRSASHFSVGTTRSEDSIMTRQTRFSINTSRTGDSQQSLRLTSRKHQELDEHSVLAIASTGVEIIHDTSMMKLKQRRRLFESSLNIASINGGNMSTAANNDNKQSRNTIIFIPKASNIADDSVLSSRKPSVMEAPISQMNQDMIRIQSSHRMDIFMGRVPVHSAIGSRRHSEDGSSILPEHHKELCNVSFATLDAEKHSEVNIPNHNVLNSLEKSASSHVFEPHWDLSGQDSTSTVLPAEKPHKLHPNSNFRDEFSVTAPSTTVVMVPKSPTPDSSSRKMSVRQTRLQQLATFRRLTSPSLSDQVVPSVTELSKPDSNDSSSDRDENEVDNVDLENPMKTDIESQRLLDAARAERQKKIQIVDDIVSRVMGYAQAQAEKIIQHEKQQMSLFHHFPKEQQSVTICPQNRANSGSVLVEHAKLAQQAAVSHGIRTSSRRRFLSSSAGDANQLQHVSQPLSHTTESIHTFPAYSSIVSSVGDPFGEHKHRDTPSVLYFVSPLDTLSRKLALDGNADVSRASQPYRDTEMMDLARLMEKKQRKEIGAYRNEHNNAINQLKDKLEGQIHIEQLKQIEERSEAIAAVKRTGRAISMDMKIMKELSQSISNRATNNARGLVSNWQQICDDRVQQVAEHVQQLTDVHFLRPIMQRQRRDQLWCLDIRQMQYLVRRLSPTDLALTSGVANMTTKPGREETKDDRRLKQFGLWKSGDILEGDYDDDEDNDSEADDFFPGMVGSQRRTQSASGKVQSSRKRSSTKNAHQSIFLTQRPSSQSSVASSVVSSTSTTKSNVYASPRAASTTVSAHLSLTSSNLVVLQGHERLSARASLDLHPSDSLPIRSSMHPKPRSASAIIKSRQHVDEEIARQQQQQLAEQRHMRVRRIQRDLLRRHRHWRHDFQHCYAYATLLESRLMRNQEEFEMLGRQRVRKKTWFVALLHKIQRLKRSAASAKTVPQSLFLLLAALRKLIVLNVELNKDVIWKLADETVAAEEYGSNLIYSALQMIFDSVGITAEEVYQRLKTRLHLSKQHVKAKHHALAVATGAATVGTVPGDRFDGGGGGGGLLTGTGPAQQQIHLAPKLLANVRKERKLKVLRQRIALQQERRARHRQHKRQRLLQQQSPLGAVPEDHDEENDVSDDEASASPRTRRLLTRRRTSVEQSPRPVGAETASGAANYHHAPSELTLRGLQQHNRLTAAAAATAASSNAPPPLLSSSAAMNSTAKTNGTAAPDEAASSAGDDDDGSEDTMSVRSSEDSVAGANNGLPRSPSTRSDDESVLSELEEYWMMMQESQDPDDALYIDLDNLDLQTYL